MDKKMRGNVLGRILCEAFGLDPNQTQDLTLYAPVTGAARLDVQMLVYDSQGNRIGSELRRYSLVEDDE